MNNRKICVFDLETASPEKDSCQIIQIAAQIIDDRRLAVVDEFMSWIQPDWLGDGYTESTIEWHVEQRNKKKKEEDKESVEDFKNMLKEQPTIETVWPKFVNWVDQHNKSKGNMSSYHAPIPAGYNINGFDIPIIDRYCIKHGTTQKDKPRLFNPIYSFDLLQHMWFWTENLDDPDIKDRLKLAENIKPWMGFPQERIDCAHDALEDVKDTSLIIIKLFKAQRYLTGVKPVETEGGKIIMKRRFDMRNSY